MSNRSVFLSHAVRSHGKQNRVVQRGEHHPGSIDERVFQISKISPGQDRPLVIASCGKASAQRLLAALASQEGPDRYSISAVFENGYLPGLEHAGVTR